MGNSTHFFFFYPARTCEKKIVQEQCSKKKMSQESKVEQTKKKSTIKYTKFSNFSNAVFHFLFVVDEFSEVQEEIDRTKCALILSFHLPQSAISAAALRR